MTEPMRYDGLTVGYNFHVANIINDRFDMIDVEASAAEYTRQLSAELSERFPGAIVKVGSLQGEGNNEISRVFDTRIYGWAGEEDDDLDREIECIAYSVWSRYEWVADKND